MNNDNNFNDKDNKDLNNNIIDEPSFVMVDKDDDYKNHNYNKGKNDNNKKNKKSKNKIGGFIVGGIICAMLGGAIGATGVYFITKNQIKNDVKTQQIQSGPAEFASAKGNLTIPEVVKKVAPAVVTVSTKSIVQNNFTVQEQEGVGTGFIINNEGYIVTNYHVIQGASQVKVTFSDGKEVNAKIINYNPEYDLAVIKITDKVEMPAVAELGDSDGLQSGDQVIAIGNPLGKQFAGTVTQGIVSATHRVIDMNGRKATFIQTDAAINPGNSGGPLLNAKGQVIGVNAAKIGGDTQGIGFAIPINIVKENLGQLSKPILKLGIQVRNIDEQTAKANNLVPGVYVIGVQEFSPAEKAGLQAGDLITKADGERIKSVDELNKVKDKHKAGDKLKLQVYRNGKYADLDIELVE